MLIIKVNQERGIEPALKAFKNKVQRTKLVQELKERSEFTKKSIKKRQTKLKAAYIQQLRDKPEY